MINLKKNQIILASASPRRSLLLTEMGVEHKTVKIEFDETIPFQTPSENVSLYIAKLKATQVDIKKKSDIVITSDTVVVHNDTILGKPKDKQQAQGYLKALSGDNHEVITGVCITSQEKQLCFKSTSTVYFKTLTDLEIDYYIEKYKPYDKAGSYGIQEWIGMIGIEKIEGSYFNIMGLPTEELYKQLNIFLA